MLIWIVAASLPETGGSCSVCQHFQFIVAQLKYNSDNEQWLWHSYLLISEVKMEWQVFSFCCFSKLIPGSPFTRLLDVSRLWSTREGFQFVHHRGWGVPSLWSQVPSQPLPSCPFCGYPRILSLVLSKVLFWVLPRGGRAMGTPRQRGGGGGGGRVSPLAGEQVLLRLLLSRRRTFLLYDLVVIVSLDYVDM